MLHVNFQVFCFTLAMPINFLKGAASGLHPAGNPPAAKANIPLTLRRQAGYDHDSYYFISTFMSDHLHWHAERLKG